MVVVLSLVAVTLLVLVSWKLPCAYQTKATIAIVVTTSSCFGKLHQAGKPAQKFKALYQNHLKTKIKLFVAFFQISSLLHSSYAVPYPYKYLEFLSDIRFLSVDFAHSLPGPCIFGPSYTFTRKVYVVGVAAFGVYVMSVLLWKLSHSHNRPLAKYALSLLPSFIFLIYPGFTAFFFDALKCRQIDGKPYAIADVSVECQGPDYELLFAFSSIWVACWACALPLVVFALLWQHRGTLKHGQKPQSGIQQHLSEFCAPYKHSVWYFEFLDFAKKLLVIGIIPACRGDVAGAVIAMLVVNAFMALLLMTRPYLHPEDNFLAICLHGLLSIVILVSVLLKMDAASLANDAAEGIDEKTITYLLVTCNILVVVISVASYVVSIRSQKPDNTAEVLLEFAAADANDADYHLVQDSQSAVRRVYTNGGEQGAEQQQFLTGLSTTDVAPPPQLRAVREELRLEQELREREQKLRALEQKRDQAKISELLALLAESGEGDLLS
jgi:hypothetical protein